MLVGMLLPIPVWCFVAGAFFFIAAFNSKSVWEIAAGVTLGAFLWFLGLKEWCYQNRKR
jgi:hypothetical protein